MKIRRLLNHPRGGEYGDYIIWKIIEIRYKKIKIDNIQPIVDEVSLLARLNPLLEFLNSRINRLLIKRDTQS